MKKLLALLSLAVAAQPALAVSDYEPFADATAFGGSPYTSNSVFCAGFTGMTGLILTTNATGSVWGCLSNLAGAAVSAVPVFTNVNLTYPGFDNSLGNALYIPPVTGNMGRSSIFSFGPVGTGTCYYSFLLKVTDVSTLSASPTANMLVGFGDGSGPQRAAVARAQACLVTEKSGSGYKLGMTKSPPNVTTRNVYDTTTYNVGDTVLVVASFDDTTAGHPASLWINPPSSSFGGATPPTPTLVTTNGTAELAQPQGAQCIMLGDFSAAPPACIVDDLRVGLTWAVVTGAPDIQTQPASTFTNAGTTATLSVFATGVLPLSYQWVRNGTNLPNAGQFSGANTATLSITNVTANEQDNYTVVITNAYGAVTSSVANLSVQDPGIIVPPASQTRPPGASAIFTVQAGGIAPLTYGWTKDGNPLGNGGNISGAASASLTVANISFADAGAYVVFVTNGLNNIVQSSQAFLTVQDPAILVGPLSSTNNYGTTATFSVTAAGQTTLSYQWYNSIAGNLNDGGNISGSHTSTLTITGVSYVNAADYYVTMTDTAGSISTTTPATLTVIEPIITQQPVSVTTNQGSSAVFNVAAIGANVTYQWAKNGAAYTADGGNISGSQTANLTVSGLSAGDDATYTAKVSDDSHAVVTSAGAVLLVLTSPAITVQASPLTITPGNTASFAVGISGTAPITYYWYSNGVNVSVGPLPSYTLTNVQLGMSGGFSVIASNIYGAATSSVVPLTVVPSIHLYSTNLVVIRVGDGAQTQDFDGNSVFLDQYTKSGTYLNTVSIPDSSASSLIEMGPDVNGTTITGTELSLSQDGLELVLGGYNTPRPYTGVLFNSTSSAVPRGIGMVNSGGHFILPISDHNAYGATYFRGAASDGTNNFWGAGNAGGTYYFGTSAPATNIQSTFPNLRTVAVFNGSLFSVSGSAGGVGILQWPGVLPTSATAPTDLFIPGATPTDMALDANGTNMYLGTSLGVMNYQFSGGTWNFQYTITASAVRYLTVDYNQTPPVIYATTSDSVGARLLAITDLGGSAASVAVIATAGVNQNLRGVRFGPSDPYFTFTHDANNIVLSWNGLYNLQASTNLSTGFTTIPGATSPFTNAFTNGTQVFFRLQQ